MLTDLTEEMTELTENNIKSIGGTVRSWASYELEEYLAEAGIDTYHLSRSDMEPAIEAHLKGNQWARNHVRALVYDSEEIRNCYRSRYG